MLVNPFKAKEKPSKTGGGINSSPEVNSSTKLTTIEADSPRPEKTRDTAKELATANHNINDSQSLNLELDLDPMKNYVLDLLKKKSIPKNTPLNPIKRSLIKPELIQGFEKLAAAQIIPFQKTLKAESHKLEIPLEKEFHGDPITFNGKEYKLDKEPPEDDRKAHPKDPSKWDWRYEFFKPEDYAKSHGKRVSEFKFIEETAPISKTVYDEQGLFPVRRIVLNFKNPENEQENIRVTYNAGKWLCGNLNCTRGLEIDILEANKNGDLENKETFTALDPTQNKRRSWLGEKLFRQGPFPAPVSLRVESSNTRRT
ncbi:MAG: hypothetical protein ACKO3R_00785 [bacterium]